MYSRRSYRRRAPARRRTRRPRRTTTRNYRKKIVQRKAYPHNKGAMTIRRLFPERLFAKLEYCDLFTLTINTSTAGAWGAAPYQVFQSSLYDPDLTGTGHQPMYYDQLMQASTVYSYYRVYGIGYTIEFVNTNTIQSMEAAILFTPVAASITVASKADWIRLEEQADVRSITVGPQATKPKIVKGYMSVAKACGVSPSVVKNDDRFRALYNANPAELAYMQVYVTSGNVSSSNVCQLKFRLTYYAEFTGLSISTSS